MENQDGFLRGERHLSREPNDEKERIRKDPGAGGEELQGDFRVAAATL